MSTGKTKQRAGILAGRGLRRLFCVLLALFVLPMGVVSSQPGASFAAHQTTGEYELKAVYLYNFLHFVQWPREKLVDRDTPFVIGLVGVSPLGAALADLQKNLVGKARREIKVVFHGPYEPGMDFACCDLVFFTESEHIKFPEILAGLKNRPTLTVAEHEGFLADGGMINLVRYEDKVRWEINRSALKNAGLRLSAKLMDIAVQVVD